MSKRKSILLLVTYACNLRCVYCYEPKRLSRRMTAEQAKRYIVKAVNEIEEEYTEFDIQFMGGEPLMEFALIKDVSEWLWAQSFHIPLAGVFAPTNGTLLNDEMRAWLTRNRDRFSLGLSFDGTRLMQNVNRTGSAGDIDIGFFVSTWPHQSVKMTVSPATIGQLAKGVIALHRCGFAAIQADLASGNHIGWEQKHLATLSSQLNELKDYYLSHPDVNPASLLSTRWFDAFAATPTSDKKCGCGESFICIDCDGQTYACHLFAPITASPSQARESLSINFKDHRRFLSDTCRDCLLVSVCNICHGMNYLCNGDVSIQSPFTCQAFKIEFYISCELHLALAEQRGDKALAQKIKSIINQIED